MDIIDSTVISTEFVSTTNFDAKTHDIHVPKIWNMTHFIITSSVLGLIILCTIVGNVFVIAAVILEKNLHNVANYLIVSLAVTGCMLAIIVMPISAVNEVTQHWFMGPEVCGMWIAMDVLCCTASIYGLVAISVDRFWAVTNIDYIRKRTNKRISFMITIVWIASLSISIPSILLFRNDPDVTGACTISQDLLFTIFSTVGAFYLPSVLLLLIYTMIFFVARKRILRKQFSEKSKDLDTKLSKNISPQFKTTPEMALERFPTYECSTASKLNISETSFSDTINNCKNDVNDSTMQRNDARKEIMRAKLEKEMLKKKRERKLARTLIIITGSYIICWFPFSIVATSSPFIKSDVNIPPLVVSITLWLGYFNSLLNPIIYTIFNEDFRKAFKDILCRRCLKKVYIRFINP